MNVSLVLIISWLSLIGYATCQMYEPPDDDLIGQRNPNNINTFSRRIPYSNVNPNINFGFNGLMRFLMSRFMRIQRPWKGMNSQDIRPKIQRQGGYPERTQRTHQQHPLPFGPSSSPYRANNNNQRSTSIGQNRAPYRPQFNSLQQRFNRLFKSFLQRLQTADLDLDEIIHTGQGHTQFAFID